MQNTGNANAIPFRINEKEGNIGAGSGRKITANHRSAAASLLILTQNPPAKEGIYSGSLVVAVVVEGKDCALALCHLAVPWRF
jgi:hypothetical protein